jgi:hypothetical protein
VSYGTAIKLFTCTVDRIVTDFAGTAVWHHAEFLTVAYGTAIKLLACKVDRIVIDFAGTAALHYA